jgi:4-aminobutyrate aminotransferase/(S)-3-amino-2-methylpropionate transaminase
MMNTQVSSIERNIVEQQRAFLLHSLARPPADKRIIFVEGKGAILKDIQGREYIDGISGTNGPLLVGHSHPKVVRAIQDQAEKLCQHMTCFDNIPAIEAAGKLHKIVPPDWKLGKTYFSPGGGEAVEVALKLIMKQTHKSEVISLYLSYHGLSLGTMSLGGMPWLRDYIPGGIRWPGFHQIPNAYCYRCPYGLKYPDCGLQCATELESAIKYASSGNVAAFIMEPVQGPGGHIEFPDEYYKEVRRICDDNDILLIVDEVQTGLGRCGSMFASQLHDLKPDVLILGKALGGGLPIGAVMFREDLTPPDLENGTWHSLTFQNNPLVCAAASAVLDVIQEERLPQRAKELGAKFTKEFKAVAEEYPVLGDVRGPGLFIGLEFVKEAKRKQPATTEVGQAIWYALEKGLITFSGGVGNVLKVKPTLVISDEQANKLLQIMKQTIVQIDRSINS